jgi:hypothetical protein
MSKASIIRQIVDAGYTAKSPNTLRRYPLDVLQGILDGLQAMPEQSSPCVPHVVSEDMESYVAAVPAELPAPISVPSDRELYVLALRHETAPPVIAGPVQSSAERWIGLALAPWTFMLQVCGIA